MRAYDFVFETVSLYLQASLELMVLLLCLSSLWQNPMLLMLKTSLGSKAERKVWVTAFDV